MRKFVDQSTIEAQINENKFLSEEQIFQLPLILVACFMCRYFFMQVPFFRSLLDIRPKLMPVFISTEILLLFTCSWRAGIEKMLKHRGCPIIFTEFTLEDQKDNLNMIQKIGAVDVCVEPRRNPFCSRRPVRCTDKSGNYKAHSVIYTNDFICVVKPA